MLSLKTADLIHRLDDYSFFDWDQEREDKLSITVGMSPKILEVLEVPTFYESWGYEAVNNENAPLSLEVKQWRLLEEQFFSWLKKAEAAFLPDSQAIVTPNLCDYWFPHGSHFPTKLPRGKTWEKADHHRYALLLAQGGVVDLGTPRCRQDYRGAVVENFEELLVLGKMSTRNFKLLFFANKDRVYKITEYLTVTLEMKDEEAYRKVRETLTDMLDPFILYETSVL